jgi:hypothetical protein
MNNTLSLTDDRVMVLGQYVLPAENASMLIKNLIMLI